MFLSIRHDDKEAQFFEKSWLLSYADLFTLLFMIITVVAGLYYLQIESNVETMDQLTEQKEAMEKELQILTDNRDKMSVQLAELHKEMEEMKRRAIILDDELLAMKDELEQLLHQSNITVEETSEGLVLRIQDSLLFASGSASLNPEGEKLIANLAEIMGNLDNKIRIEGHTDNIPSNTAQFPSNWELSTARSISVMKEFVHKYHFAPERFIIAGWGEYKPLVDNSTNENRALNRRVEIVLLNSPTPTLD